MKRFAALLLALCLLLPTACAEKTGTVSDLFAVRYETEERKVDDNRYFVSKETMTTVNEAVNAELRALCDELDERLAPTMQPDPRKNARRNSRLDIEVVHSFTGDKWLSALVLGRVSFAREQLESPFHTRTWDMETGERIWLTDIFPADSAAWALLAERVESHVSQLFPNDERSPEAVAALCAREALEEADFTLSAMELTLHYEAKTVYPNQPGLMHVRLFYDELWDHMTPEARVQTDNTDMKMVAITCDDGPAYEETAKVLVNMRHAGIRATFFTVGKKVAGNPDILHRTFDQNHIIATHTYNHWGGGSMKPETRLEEVASHNELLFGITGEAVTMFRAPGGTFPPWIEADIRLPVIQWSVDTYDYTGKSAKKIFYSIRNNVQDGDVILCHDSGKQFFKSIPIFAEWLRENGYLLVTVEELARMNGVIMQPNEVYYRFIDGDTSKRNDSNT